jgi:hypothetical protein
MSATPTLFASGMTSGFSTFDMPNLLHVPPSAGGSRRNELVASDASIVASAIVTSQKPIAAVAQNVNLMKAAGLRAKRLVRLALKMFKMQAYQSGIFRVCREVVGGVGLPSAQSNDSSSDFFRQMINMFGVPWSVRIA